MLKNLADALNKNMKKIETKIIGQKFALGIYAAFTVVVTMGILIVHSPRKKIQEAIRNKTSNVVIKVELRDLDKLIVERKE